MLPKGVDRVRRKLASGKSRFHFYAWRGRGAPKFWEDEKRKLTDSDFYIAFAEVAERSKTARLTIPKLVDSFLSSAVMPKGERSKHDLRQ
jgi:hypothetical protein